jgi:DNA-binding NarL/FixJ family response regulator
MGLFTSEHCLDGKDKECPRFFPNGIECFCPCHKPFAAVSRPKPPKPEIRLTKHQLSALQRMAEGRTLKQAAAELGISVSALTSRLTAAYAALGAKNRAEAVLNAREAGLI